MMEVVGTRDEAMVLNAMESLRAGREARVKAAEALAARKKDARTQLACMAGGVSLSPRKLHPDLKKQSTKEAKDLIAQVEQQEHEDMFVFSTSGRCYYDAPGGTKLYRLHPAPEVDVADVLSELDQEAHRPVRGPNLTPLLQELESARLRADAVFSKLHSHHARWGGIVADEMAVHFGGENHLFEKLNSNHDGEVTSQVYE